MKMIYEHIGSEIINIHVEVTHEDFEKYLRDAGKLTHTRDEYEPETGHKQTETEIDYWDYIREHLTSQDIKDFLKYEPVQ